MDAYLKELLQSTESAGTRTRAVLSLLLAVCVLGVTALLNGALYGWAGQRARVVASDTKYAARKLGYIDDFEKDIPDEKSDHKKSKKTRAEEFSDVLIKEYVQNAYPIKIPIFGVVFDMYDLTLVLGLGYSIILMVLVYCVNTETTALRLVWSSSSREPDLSRAIYAILATRQVLTVPKTGRITDPVPITPLELKPHDGSATSWFRSFPKWSFRFPGVVYSLIVANDVVTLNYGWYISPVHTTVLVVYSIVFTALIWYLVVKCLSCLKAIDSIWDDWFEALKEGPIPPAPQRGADSACTDWR